MRSTLVGKWEGSGNWSKGFRRRRSPPRIQVQVIPLSRLQSLGSSSPGREGVCVCWIQNLNRRCNAGLPFLKIACQRFVLGEGDCVGSCRTESVEPRLRIQNRQNENLTGKLPPTPANKRVFSPHSLNQNISSLTLLSYLREEEHVDKKGNVDY